MIKIQKKACRKAVSGIRVKKKNPKKHNAYEV